MCLLHATMSTAIGLVVMWNVLSSAVSGIANLWIVSPDRWGNRHFIPQITRIRNFAFPKIHLPVFYPHPHCCIHTRPVLVKLYPYLYPQARVRRIRRGYGHTHTSLIHFLETVNKVLICTIQSMPHSQCSHQSGVTAVINKVSTICFIQ